MAKGLGIATLALGAFWAGWKAGEFLAEQLGVQENAVANWWDGIREAFGAESVADIRASADAVSQTFGTYRTQAEIAADETARLAQILADELAPALVTVNTAAGDGVDPATRYAEAIAALGIIPQEELDTELENLAIAIKSGEQPVATMRPLLEEYRKKLEEIGRLNPEVGKTIDALTQDINEQDAAVDGIVGTMPAATNALDLFGGSMAGLPASVKATGDSIEDALTRMAAASDSNAFALAEVIAEGLSRLGHETVTVNSGEAAISRVGAQRFDVVVTDMRMPGMDGSQLLVEVMRRCPATVRMILSGQCERQSVLKCVGPTHQFLTKPCDSQMLKTTVARACRLRDHLPEEWIK
ncbi:hypothetical protein LCGC14_2669500, partial [marine sediment metagenome]